MGSPTRVAVQVVIYSEAISPGEIASRLRLQPTRTAEKGIKYGPQTGTQVNVPRHMWQLSSETNVEDSDLGSHLDWLLSKLLPVREQLCTLRNIEAVECVLFCVVWTSGTSAHVTLTANQMESLVALQLDLQLEFADYGTDD